MRTVLFASLFLISQYVSSFNIPFGIAKALLETLIVPTEKSETNSSSLDKSNKIDEKEIFENGDDKANNLSERSFVWINTRFKSPLKAKIYNTKIDEFKLDSLYPFRRAQHDVLPLPQRQYPPPPKTSTSLAAQQHIPDFPMNQRLPAPPSPTSPLFRPHHDIKIPCTIPNKHSTNTNKSSKCNQGFSKPHVYETFRKVLPKMVPHLNNNLKAVKPPLIAKPYHHEDVPDKNPRILNSITRSKFKDTYGFPSLYQLHRSVFSSDEINYKPEDINLEGNLFTDNNFVLGPSDGNDEDKLLERYIKHTLADNGVRIFDNELQVKCKKCNGSSNPNCKCDDITEVKSKLAQFIENKTKQLDSETTTERKNKISEYDDSNDESILNKTVADVLLAQ